MLNADPLDITKAWLIFNFSVLKCNGTLDLKHYMLNGWTQAETCLPSSSTHMKSDLKNRRRMTWRGGDSSNGA
jgi:hypothetical protein